MLSIRALRMDMRTLQAQRIKKGRVHKIVRKEKVPHPQSHGHLSSL